MEPRWNLGVLFAAALFADLLLWALVLVGAESVGAPLASGRARFFTFAFPYPHGALASAGWTLAAAALGWAVGGAGTPRRARLACALAIAVASHFLLDFVVHVPDLPVAGGDSAKLGLGLWRAMPAALAVEPALAGAALAVCMRRAPLPRWRGALLVTVVAITGILTALGPYLPGEPPPATTLAASSLLTLAVVVFLGFVVEGRARWAAPHRDSR
ncbi:MAG: hypothetical protein KA200_05610 [Burkholderiales bacterium]|nr:hypothetical protein [Burkholderiales bacterium]